MVEAIMDLMERKGKYKVYLKMLGRVENPRIMNEYGWMFHT
jgi:hypothetical protein